LLTGGGVLANLKQSLIHVDFKHLPREVDIRNKPNPQLPRDFFEVSLRQLLSKGALDCLVRRSSFLSALQHKMTRGSLCNRVHPDSGVKSQGAALAFVVVHGDLAAEFAALHAFGGVAEAIGAAVEVGVVDLVGIAD
jgi:Flp pilus assembly CpaE family ATPase